MNITNLDTLKIHKLTKEQYERQLATGNIDENAIYLTPDEEMDLSGYVTSEQLDSKADAEHAHDDRYYTEAEIDGKFSAVNTSITNITNGDVVVKKAETAETAEHATSADSATNANHATSADTATSATSATKATQDGNGKVISSTYETKTDATAKLNAAKEYTDSAVSGKADSDHTHDDRYFTESEITTKLAGKSDTGHNHNTAYDAKGTAEEKANAVQANLDVVSDELTGHTDNTDIHVTAAKKTNWDKAYTHSQATHARTDATNVADSTTNGNILINGTETNVYSHPNSGVTAGTYKSVTVNAQGHVTGGSNPTTLAGYGITDAESKGAANTALNSAKEYTDSVASGKADSEHTHDGRYYTESEIDSKLSGKSDTSHNHNTSYDSKGTASSAVSTHNTATTAHSDIRDLITGLTTRLNALANSTDEDLDQMAEIVEYIKSNKSLIDSITTSKVNVSDIVNNLTTNVTNKPLSAAQGVAIKALIDALQTEVDNKADSSALTSHTGNTSNPHSVTKAQVGLGNVENKSSAAIRGEITKANVTTALGYTPYTQTEVDDLLDGKSDDGHGHAIADVSGLQSALDGKASSSHGTHVSYSTTAPVMDGTASVGSASTVARSDHKHPTDTTRAAKTDFDSHTGDTTAHITSTERTNWNAAKTHADSAHAPSNAQANQNAFSNVKVGDTTIAADTTTDTLTLAGSNVTITPDATNDKITFSVADGSTSAKGVVQLTNSTSSTSTTTAATPSSVKSAYDLANTAKTNAATAQTRADNAYTLAESKADNLSDLGVTATAAELNYMDGVTSAVQTQLDSKASVGHGHSVATISADGFMSSTDKSKLDGIDTGANNYSLPTASSSTLGGVKIGNNISISNGEISVPTASGTQAGVTIVYPAASCTTFSSDTGTVTPLAVQKGAKQFAITRPSTSTNKAITRYSNTTGDVQDSEIIIEDVTNTRDGSSAQIIAIPAAAGAKKMVYGYCTDQVDGTSFIGGLFDASATEYPYSSGLAIGGSSGNLLWKGAKVATFDDLADKLSITGTAAKATADASGNVITSHYETKSDSQSKYDEITSAKADWNQNDPIALDYVKNRTHYEIPATNTLKYDGIIDGKEIVDLNDDGTKLLVKISSAWDIEVSELDGVLIEFEDSTIFRATSSAFNDLTSVIPLIMLKYDSIPIFYVVKQDNLSLSMFNYSGKEIPTKGVWIWVADSASSLPNGCVKTITAQTAIFGPILKKLDNKFLPDEVALKSDIPTDDHINNLINEALEVIENGTY